MKRSLIRYKTKAESAEENERLIRAVFTELHAKSPDGVRYMALWLEDGSFVHFFEAEAGEGAFSMPSLKAFRAFQSGIRDRTIEPPQAGEAKVVGNYRMLAE